MVGGGSVRDDLGGVSTGDEVMLTSPPELAHCWGGYNAYSPKVDILPFCCCCLNLSLKKVNIFLLLNRFVF